MRAAWAAGCGTAIFAKLAARLEFLAIDNFWELLDAALTIAQWKQNFKETLDSQHYTMERVYQADSMMTVPDIEMAGELPVGANWDDMFGIP